MSATTMQLLHAAGDIVGGREALARELGIGELLLAKYMSDSRELPDALLLRAVDIILADRQMNQPWPGQARVAHLPPLPEIPQNPLDGGGSARPEGGTE